MSTNAIYDHIKLRLRPDGASWAIVGIKNGEDINDFTVLAVLDAPITPELASQIAHLIAQKFANGNVIEDKISDQFKKPNPGPLAGSKRSSKSRIEPV